MHPNAHFRRMYIPYHTLKQGPVVCHWNSIKIKFQLVQSSGTSCHMTLDPHFHFQSLTPGQHETVPIGSNFELEHNGRVENFCIGRKFIIRDV